MPKQEPAQIKEIHTDEVSDAEIEQSEEVSAENVEADVEAEVDAEHEVQEEAEIEEALEEPELDDEPEEVEEPQPAIANDSLLNCLVFLTKFYGQPEQAENLRSGIPASQNTFSIENFIEASDRSGYIAHLEAMPLEKLDNMVCPCVLLLNNGQSAVLVKVKDGTYWIVMPELGEGVRKITAAELNEFYTGDVIFFQTKFHFDERSNILDLPRSKYWFWGTILSNWRIYSLALLATVLINTFVVASPLFIMITYDRVVPNSSFDTLWVLAIGVIAIAFFDFIVRTMRAYFVDFVGKRTDFVISSRLFEQVMGIEMASKQKSSGVLANTIKEFDALRDFFTSATLTTLGDLPFVFLFIFVVWLIGGPMAMIPLVAVPIVLLFGFLIQVPLGKAVNQAFQEAAQKSAHLYEVVNSLETVKCSGLQPWAQKNWETYVGRTATANTKSRMWSNVAVHFAQMMMLLTTVAVIVIGVYEIDKGEMTLGTLIACMILTSRAMAPLIQVAQLLVRHQQSNASLAALHMIMSKPVEKPADKKFIQRRVLRGDIEFRETNFTYPESPIQTLKNVSFSVKSGEKVGIVGRIGSGKSTILKMVMNLYQPESGAVLVDNIDIRQVDPLDLRKNVGYVEQDPTLFFGSVRNNITLSAPYVSDEQILRASQISGVDYFVRQHPSGYDQLVGERGEALSGGQRQAIVIARALLLDPNILLLDEPTGHMDHTTEQMFIRSLKKEIDGKTVMIVTHRTTLLTLVDRLIIVDRGEIVADGPKEEVLKALTEKS